MIVDQISVLESLFILIGECWHIVFEVKKIIGIVVNIGFWDSREANQERIKILENGAVFFENTAMRLVDNDDVKMGWGEEFLPVIGFHIIDGIHNGRIRGENRPVGRLIVSPLQEVTGGEIRHMFGKCLFGLTHQFDAVSEKQNIGDVIMR